jgi:hypothetical protein
LSNAILVFEKTLTYSQSKHEFDHIRPTSGALGGAALVSKELWEVEIAHSIEQGCAPDVARAFTVIRCAYHGDLQPLAGAIKAGSLHDAVLGFLADMIDMGRLQMVPRGRGHPKMPESDRLAGHWPLWSQAALPVDSTKGNQNAKNARLR